LITEVGSVVRQAGQKNCHLGIDERLKRATVPPPFPSGKLPFGSLRVTLCDYTAYRMVNLYNLVNHRYFFRGSQQW